MTTGTYDAIIVGARCAGATLASYLARGGASVLVVDKDPLASDQVLSTHLVHGAGMEVLDEVGVGDAVRTVAPAMRVVRLRKNSGIVDVPMPNGRYEYCPRRARLDSLLQRAAEGAGATVLDRTRVTDIVWRDGRAAGVRAMREGGECVFNAPLVVGADGRHSTIAQLAGAEEYLGYDGPRAAYWGYWKAPACWKTDPAYQFDMYVGNTNGYLRVIFHTDEDHLLIGCSPRIQEVAAWRANPREAFRRHLASDDVTGLLIDGADPVEEVRGTLKERYFFRRATGPGWVLLGDAGHHKDFNIGDGITEALLQARSLAHAIRSGTDAALVEWWRARDVEAIPYFFFAEDEGGPEPPLDLECLVFSRVASRPDLLERLALAMNHRISPYDTVPLGDVVRWTLSGVLRGRLGLVRDFFAKGRRGAAVGRELSVRRRLLQEASAQREQSTARATV
jgi:menaquinone-9 beta-reductase